MYRLLTKLLFVVFSEIEWFAHCVRLALKITRNTIPPQPLNSVKTPPENRPPFAAGPPIRVTAFTHNLNREGAPISLFELLSELRRTHQIEFSLVSFKDGPLRESYKLVGIPVTIENVNFAWVSHYRLKNILEKIAVLIKERKSDLIIANTLMCFPAILAADQVGVPSVWIPRESEPWRDAFDMLPPSVAEKAVSAITLAKRVIFVSDTTRRVWKDFETTSQFHVIYNAVDLSRFEPSLGVDKKTVRGRLSWETDEIVILLVGTLCKRKGQADLLKALSFAKDNIRQPLRVVFVGDEVPAYATRLKEAAASNTRRTPPIHFEFRLSTPDIGSLYAAADIFVMCSRLESYPRVILEAMAFGLAIITTRVFGISEQLTGVDDAYFYEPDDYQTLGSHLINLISNPEKRKMIGENARRRCAAFPTYSDMTNDYAKVIREAAK